MHCLVTCHAVLCYDVFTKIVMVSQSVLAYAVLTMHCCIYSLHNVKNFLYLS